MSKRKLDCDEELTLKEAANLVVPTVVVTPPVPRSVHHTSVGEQAEALGRWATKVVEALTWSRFSSLRSLSLDILKLSGRLGTMHSEALEDTGAGVLVADRTIWSRVDGETAAAMAGLAVSWKSGIAGATSSRQGVNLKAAKPLGGLSAERFEASLKVFLDFAALVDPFTSTFTTRMVCKAFALRQLSSVESLASVASAESDIWLSTPSERALAAKMLHRALVKTTSARASEVAIAEINPAALGSRAQRQSASVFACSIAPVHVDALNSSLNIRSSSSSSLCGLSTTLTPRQAVASLAVAKANGTDVDLWLQDKALSLKLHSRLASLPSVRSGLANWHAFATLILDYESGATLPPNEASHVVAWIATFRNAGTASNYVGHVKWACTCLGLAHEHWFNDEVRLVLKGQQKLHLTLVGESLKVKFLLADDCVHLLLLYLQATAPGDLTRLLLLLGWEFLMRMQSEAFPLESGRAEEFSQLPVGRHSAVFVDNANCLCIRWRRRKHRPEGSLLKRPCRCHFKGVGLTGEAACATHTYLEFQQRCGWVTGTPMFPDLSPAKTLLRVKRLLTMMGTPNATFMTWKAVRAGRASAMAASGCSLGSILTAGEWRSSAYLRYVSEEVADAGQVLRMTLQSEIDDDDEGIGMVVLSVFSAGYLGTSGRPKG